MQTRGWRHLDAAETVPPGVSLSLNIIFLMVTFVSIVLQHPVINAQLVVEQF